MKKQYKVLIGVVASALLVLPTSFSQADASGAGKGQYKHEHKHPQLNNSPQNVLNQEHVTVAHRGASGYAPEHTFPAYDMSHNQLNADYIEIDLQMTKDGHLVAMHDEEVDRTTNGTGRVEDYTLAELKQLDAGSWFNEENPEYAKASYKGAQVQTLDEIINHYGTDANYYIETKSPDVYPGMEEKLLSTLDRHGLLKNNKLRNGHVLVQSFSTESLLKMNHLNGRVPLVQLLDKASVPYLDEDDWNFVKSYAVGVGPEYTDLTQKNTQIIKDHGLDLHPYTVNDKESMKQLNEYGVNGVFTNYTDVYNDVSGK
ncbi:glycerophosphodiester phosphodiesterase [Staphylococcus massiliensis]|uniref:glycerophosphodiester phosphodiesterase n=1 Tax=Staphylococcus massiliensis TaxID=555791 RepID=UPI001EDE31A5|nr:glycerophosphodiester phosphodiesterase [Staphylococcus massiliensis]MCG3400006.1 glycerophosphodiester phosphodiesterase [Staphylococcus massiliensis]